MSRLVLGLGIVLMTVACVLIVLGTPFPALLLAGIFGLLLIVGTVFERRYKPLQRDVPGLGWKETGNAFSIPRQTAS